MTDKTQRGGRGRVTEPGHISRSPAAVLVDPVKGPALAFPYRSPDPRGRGTSRPSLLLLYLRENLLSDGGGVGPL